MYKIVLSLSIFIAYYIQIISAHPIGVSSKTSSQGQFPYQVMLLSKRWLGRTLCGGTLLNEEWILTAAHCLIGAREIQVDLGATDFENDLEQGRIIVQTDEYILHEEYNPQFAANDIGLVRLAEKIKYTNKIQPAKLPFNFINDTFEGRRAIASGWGATKTSTTSNEMKYTDYKVISNRQCMQDYKKSVINSGVMCAVGMDLDTVCRGDSGGPLVLKHSKILIGVTSFGPTQGCEHGTPGGFTRVTHYLDWIQSKIYDNNES